MKSREKRRRRQLRKARRRLRIREIFARFVDRLKNDPVHRALYLEWQPVREKWGKEAEAGRAVTSPLAQGEVGYTGDIIELLEYPCNCEYCRGETERQKRKEREAGRSL